VVRDPDGVVTEFNGHDDSTTNNRMELTAAVEGLRATERGAQVILRSDSQYVVNSMTLHWKRNKNQDLWEMLDAEVAARRVRFEWVRGHDSDATNNRADELALMGANGRLLAEGATAGERKTRASKSDNSVVESELTVRLKLGESIRECARCGAKFVSRRDGDDYCALILCQLEARRR